MKMLLLGDISPTDVTAPLFKKEDVSGLFSNSLSIFENKDFVFANLECAITESDGKIIDLILYKIPMFTNTIEIPSFERLLQEKRIAGMKDSSANMKQIEHEAGIVRRNRPDFALMTGTDDCIVPALLAGCVGSVTAFSVILPEINAKIYELFNAGHITEAQDLNRKALKLLRLADSVMFPSGYKLVYEQRGFPMGHCQVVDEQAIRALRLSMRAELDELFRGIKKIK